MGKDSISYKQNQMPLETAKKYYTMDRIIEASFDWSKEDLPDWKQVVDVEEFSNGEYAFRFEDGGFAVMKGKSLYW